MYTSLNKRMRDIKKYQKYYYQRPLTIIKVRCTSCGNTHAIMIPEFSLSGTSIVSTEVHLTACAEDKLPFLFAYRVGLCIDYRQ